jgi:predicted house-cleaning noncanonical NTP pyrophosphatase (MazG superfamily)
LRYKGSFIAPDHSHAWITYTTKAPYDWAKSVTKDTWLSEIAETTRRIAERDGYPVNVMWFVNNHPLASPHKVLPWYHQRSESLDRVRAVSPRHKFRPSTDRIIKTSQDWHAFKEFVADGNRAERVIVQPIDPDLIRNRHFAEELGSLASERKFVVEMAGGILSHAYYILRRLGADVECVDLFGSEEDVAEYNKIIRDEIPKQIESRGERVEMIQLKADALILALKRKLVEEAYEALDARAGAELVGELADVEEVILALLKSVGYSKSQFESDRNAKRNSRGAFDKGLMLLKTATPHSIRHEALSGEVGKLALQGLGESRRIVTDPGELPGDQVYRRPDLRRIEEGEVEKLITFELGASLLDKPSRQTYRFKMPSGSRSTAEFELDIELLRVGSGVRGMIALRSEVEIGAETEGHQLKLDFSAGRKTNGRN